MKINLSNLLLFIAVIVIIIMGAYIYKHNTTSKATNLVVNSNSDDIDFSEDFIKNEFEIAWNIFKQSYNIFQYDNQDIIKVPVQGENFSWEYYKITNFEIIINKYISSSFSNLTDNMDMIISKDNDYYIMDNTDGTSLDRIDNVEILEKTNDKISCIVKIHLDSITGLDAENTLEEQYEFELIKENNSWKISKFNLLKY